MDKQQRYTARIREVYPNLVIEAGRLTAEREHNDILVFDDEIIFRFPKHDECVERLEIETAVLRGIQGHITTVKVPDPIYVSLAPTVGQAFIGYRMIQGESATAGEFAAFVREEAGRSLATQLALFPKELHSVPASEAVSVNLSHLDSQAEWSKMCDRIRQNLFPHMRREAREWAAQHFEPYLSDGRHFEYEPVLRHGDIGPYNIIFDKKSATITGVIDFESAGLGDPAVDAAWIQHRSGVGESFLRAFHAAYPELEAARERARFYAGTFALQEALSGIENGDERDFRSGIAEYA